MEFSRLQSSQDREQELLNLLQSCRDLGDKREQELYSKLQAFNEILSEKKRITLEDLQLTPSEHLVLKSCDKEFRHALYKSCEHLALTAYPECCRVTALKLQDMQRKLTMSDKNKMELDETPIERAQERSKKFFTPR